MLIVGAALLVLVVVGVAAWMYSQRQSRARLRERFGPEYERTVQSVGDPARAEAILKERADRVAKFKLHSLTTEQADAFSREWRRVQARFVDDPNGAVSEADHLVTQVMTARGYPLEDFDRRAEDLSVDHPVVVDNYRKARLLATRHQRGEAGTEELRQAVVNYRALFDELLGTNTHTQRRAS
jgi:hypothetical protein